jgi:cystathionine gamma-synthase
VSVVPGAELLERPLWRPDDLGKPIPGTAHSISVALPLWEHVVGYEEGDPAIVEAMTCGYPRFVHHPHVSRLFETCEQRFGSKGERSIALPSQRVAERCVAFLWEQGGFEARVDEYGLNGIFVASFPADAFETAKYFWQHCGEIVSSRQAQSTLEQRSAQEDSGDKSALRARIGELAGAPANDVFLYPTGMAALIAAQRALHELKPREKTVQLGFPYVDLLNIQAKWGPGLLFYPRVQSNDIQQLAEYLSSARLAGAFCESPGNPLLRCPDIPRLSELFRKHEVPFVIDETVGSFANIDVMPYADVVMTSLTKYFAGTCDVMGGALIVNRDGRQYAALRDALTTDFEDLVWSEDAAHLAECGADFQERVHRINHNASIICEYLRSHSHVAEMYYPQFAEDDAYDTLKKPDGGYGGLFSMVLKDAPTTAPPFYDALRVSKGPSLGTNFTLACPYTLLAHYRELEWTEAQGVSRYLIRVSVGLEDPHDLIERFEEAFRAAGLGA